MTAERYVLLGLAPPRAAWFEELARWTTSTAIAAEFVKCFSADEVRARLATGRRHSALIVDTSMPAFDRDLVDEALSSSTPVIAVRGAHAPSFSSPDLGVSATLESGFSRDDLLEVLSSHCQMIARGIGLPAAIDDGPAPMWMAQLFVVCGPGGTGASTFAMALAQGLSSDARYGNRVVLADLARRADQAMLHDAVDLGPGLQELVEAHRLRRPDPDEVRRLTFDVPRRGYRLLLGLRQPQAWSALRPRAIDATIEGLRRSFQVVVADVTGDFEGDSEGGSIEVEERNHLARSAALQATTVVAVGSPGMKGTHSLAGLVRALVQAGVPSSRVLAAFNRSPRSPAARAEASRALTTLLAGSGVKLALPTPLHVPERKVEEALRNGTPLPSPVVDPVVKAITAVADRASDTAPPLVAPTRIQPGSLGSWSEAEQM